MSVLIDSFGWIEYFTDGPLASKYSKYIENANSSEYVAPSIVIYEVYKRIKSVKGEHDAIKAIAHIIEHNRIISINKKLALNAADISLKNNLAMADAMIKSVAEEEDAKLITSDKHFKNLSGVIFIE